MGTLLAGLEDEPRALLLTHVHLDHAGASGSLVSRFPGLRVYVHEVGAPHLVDPAKLLQSAARLYGDDMDRLWGEVLPVPADNVVALTGGESIEGFRVAQTPRPREPPCRLPPRGVRRCVRGRRGRGAHPAVRLHDRADPPSGHRRRGLGVLPGREWRSGGPQRLCLTHFGAADSPLEQLESARESLRRGAELAREGDRERFLRDLDAETARAVEGGAAVRYRQAAPPEQLWLGLERYWRKRTPAGRPRALDPSVPPAAS